MPSSVVITGIPVFSASEEDRDSRDQDRKSTRLNSSHVSTSYAVFCLKKKEGGFGDRPVRGAVECGQGGDGVGKALGVGQGVGGGGVEAGAAQAGGGQGGGGGVQVGDD